MNKWRFGDANSNNDLVNQSIAKITTTGGVGGSESAGYDWKQYVKKYSNSGENSNNRGTETTTEGQANGNANTVNPAIGWQGMFPGIHSTTTTTESQNSWGPHNDNSWPYLSKGKAVKTSKTELKTAASLSDIEVENALTKVDSAATELEEELK